MKAPYVKICGITTLKALKASAEADYAGFIFHPNSPRNLTPKQAAALSKYTHVPTVAVAVNPDDALLQGIFDAFRPAFVQLHGDEPPARVQEVKNIFKTHVIKAFRVRAESDINQAHDYEEVADILLFDAHGNGTTFDWSLLSRRQFPQPWFLSGGLNTDNVQDALRISGAKMVDVSSSLEFSPGDKDPARVRAFIDKVKSVKG